MPPSVLYHAHPPQGGGLGRPGGKKKQKKLLEADLSKKNARTLILRIDPPKVRVVLYSCLWPIWTDLAIHLCNICPEGL